MPTYNNVQNQGKLIMQSPENGQKHQFGPFFDDISQNYKFFSKIAFIQIEGRIYY